MLFFQSISAIGKKNMKFHSSLYMLVLATITVYSKMGVWQWTLIFKGLESEKLRLGCHQCQLHMDIHPWPTDHWILVVV